MKFNSQACFLVVLVVVTIGCDRSQPSPSVPQIPDSSDNNTKNTGTPKQVVDSSGDGGLFYEITGVSGLPNETPVWPDGVYLTPEITPGGVALLDYDADGDLDIYQIRHGPPAAMPKAFTIPAPNRLFRQEAKGQFVEVPDAAGMADAGYGHGAAVGDVDNDGDVDVYVTNYGEDKFYLNSGDGSFSDATVKAGFAGGLWSSAAAFFDYDRDGDLDLFVVHFATFNPGKRCKGGEGDEDEDYCGPHTFPGLRDTLYENNGDGTFSDVSAKAGIDTPARGWGVICADLTGDGWADIYVANDEEPNQLWVNQHDGTFFDEGVLRGAAFNGYGRVEASMGVSIGDVDGDQRFDLFMTHVASETNTFYATGGANEAFADRSTASGMSGVDLPYTGWGCGFFDYDHDGDLDLAVANGRVAKGPVRPEAQLGKFWNRYCEPNLLFRNEGDGNFIEIGDQAGQFASRLEVTRALAFGDLDEDGDLDLVTANIDNQLRVFRNDAPAAGSHWIMVRALTGKRDAIGAIVSLIADDKRQIGIVLPSYSYLSSNDPRVHFGLGEVDKIDGLEVTWPDGSREQFAVPGVDRVLEIRKGAGKKL